MSVFKLGRDVREIFPLVLALLVGNGDKLGLIGVSLRRFLVRVDFFLPYTHKKGHVFRWGRWSSAVKVKTDSNVDADSFSWPSYTPGPRLRTTAIDSGCCAGIAVYDRGWVAKNR